MVCGLVIAVERRWDPVPTLASETRHRWRFQRQGPPRRPSRRSAQNGGHQRVLATKWVWCCQRSLTPWAKKAITRSHAVSVIAAAASTTKADRDASLDDDDLRSSVCYGEADVDRGDQDNRNRVGSGGVEPPKHERCRQVDPAEDDAPEDGCSK